MKLWLTDTVTKTKTAFYIMTPPKIVTCIFYLKCFMLVVEYNSNIMMASVKNHSQRDLHPWNIYVYKGCNGSL